MQVLYSTFSRFCGRCLTHSYRANIHRSIEKLGDFSSIGLKNVLTNRYAVRQLIAQEVNGTRVHDICLNVAMKNNPIHFMAIQ